MRTNNNLNIRLLSTAGALACMLGWACTAEVGFFNSFVDGGCVTGSPQACPQGQSCIGPMGSPMGVLGLCLSECLVGEPNACPENTHCLPITGEKELGTCQSSCNPNAPNACPKGQACTEIEGTPTCQPLPECYVGDNMCPAGQSCVGNPGAPAGSPGRCEAEAEAECRIGENSCAEGHVCKGEEGAKTGEPGSCQPECRVGSNNGCPDGHACIGTDNPQYLEPGRCYLICHGDNNECPTGQVCIGAQAGTSGTCQMPPQCVVGDNSLCELWQNCIGISSNQVGAPGRCQGEPECRVGDNHCPAWQSCTGYESNANNAPGRCQGEPECRVGDNHCPLWQSCIGYESNANNAPGRCQGEPQCRVGNNNCPVNTQCIGYESNANGAPGTCQAAPAPRDITRLYMFFGHNSVGGEIVSGLSNQVQGLRILSYTPTSITNTAGNHFGSPTRQPGLLNVTTYGLYNTYNQAIQEVDAFTAHVRGIINGRGNIPGQPLDIVFMKFCFLAFYNMNSGQETSLFNYYAEQMDILQRDFPSLIVVHLTQTTRPCAETQSYLHAANIRSMNYRRLMLNRYASGGRVFDLTLAEATGANGNVNHCTYRDASGELVLGLRSEYAPSSTSTDGHLNTTGRNTIARELANFLANVR
ncbi:MAG: hypothetical protein FWG75_01480 [Cystobacterineae bacterium]|nr:hypothetical protein [Cystobacterineae bacterium]